MSRDLKNKTVVVTGGADGLGYEITNHFLAKGAKIAIILDINEQKGNEAVESLNTKYGDNKAVFIKCDVVQDLETVSDKIFKLYETVDVLVNNAGVFREDSVKISVAVNVTAVMEWSYKFWDYMRKDRGGNGGTIINISSIYGFRMMPTMPIYQGTKFAVFGFSKSLGHEYNFNKTGVRVVAICPGLTKTNMTLLPPALRDAEILEDLLASTAAHEWQEPKDIGRGAVEVFEKADSGSTWLIEGTKPAFEVISSYNA